MIRSERQRPCSILYILSDLSGPVAVASCLPHWDQREGSVSMFLCFVGAPESPRGVERVHDKQGRGLLQPPYCSLERRKRNGSENQKPKQSCLIHTCHSILLLLFSVSESIHMCVLPEYHIFVQNWSTQSRVDWQAVLVVPPTFHIVAQPQ